MAKRTRAALWTLWLAGTVGLMLYFGRSMYRVEEAQVFLPGKTSHGHYQIEMKCNLCHTPLMGVKQAACLSCHAAELEAANDSHPPKKFTDPRNADRVAALDARFCVTCHREHEPERTRPLGVTMPLDYCFRCHAKIGEERPSHAGLAFQTCNASGCHNFHDNRALYEDFLVQHAAEPAIAALALNPRRDFAARDRQAAPQRQRHLMLAAYDAPRQRVYDAKLLAEWAATAHARAGINCSDCHLNAHTGNVWLEKPTHAVCATCHQAERDGFLRGQHGMRLAQGLPPMTPAMARLPMKPDADRRQITCVACHRAHTFNTQSAAVDACMTCHNDAHSRAYPQSAHYRLWQKELQGTGASGSGVSCATCHLPRETHRRHGASQITVQHNQNDNLRPNEKMIRSVCMNCHGLRFAIDALADAALVTNNFAGRPGRHISSIDWAMQRVKSKRQQKVTRGGK